MTEEQLIESIKDCDIHLNFTVDTTQKMLHALGNLPFHVSAPFIQQIQQQAIPQVEVYKKAAETEIVEDVDLKEEL